MPHRAVSLVVLLLVASFALTGCRRKDPPKIGTYFGRYGGMLKNIASGKVKNFSGETSINLTGTDPNYTIEFISCQFPATRGRASMDLPIHSCHVEVEGALVSFSNFEGEANWEDRHFSLKLNASSGPPDLEGVTLTFEGDTR